MQSSLCDARMASQSEVCMLTPKKSFVEVGIYKVSVVKSNIMEWTVIAFFKPS